MEHMPNSREEIAKNRLSNMANTQKSLLTVADSLAKKWDMVLHRFSILERDFDKKIMNSTICTNP